MAKEEVQFAPQGSQCSQYAGKVKRIPICWQEADSGWTLLQYLFFPAMYSRLTVPGMAPPKFIYGLDPPPQLILLRNTLP